MAIPVFICNGHRFVTDLFIYSDGVVDCWGQVTLEEFREKLAERWVQGSARVGSRISLNGLGAATVTGGVAGVEDEQLLEWVEKLLKIMNPEGRDLAQKAAVSRGYEICFDYESDEPIWGKKLTVLRESEKGYRLVHWFIFADGRSQLDQEDPAAFEEVVQTLLSGPYTCSLPEGATLDLERLGRYQITDGNWGTNLPDRISEGRDMLRILQGKTGLIQECRQRFEEYVARPDPASKEALRQAYEAIPSHLRRFCGDMDSKDIPIRMALYGREQIEDWSHRQLARQLGHTDLPDVDVPIVDS